MEGPAATDTETRAAWLATRLGVGIDDYARRWREGQSMLAHAKEHDEVVLWFEQDLFCATNLWFVLDRLEAARVSLVFPPLSAGAGLGALTPDTFEPLFERRRALTAADVARRRRARRPRRPPRTGAARPLARRRAPAAGCAALALGPRAPHARGGVSLARRAAPLAGYTRRRAREDRTVAGRGNTAGGKSGLRRAGCWLTARGGDPTESATETYRRRKAVRVKR